MSSAAPSLAFTLRLLQCWHLSCHRFTSRLIYYAKKKDRKTLRFLRFKLGEGSRFDRLSALSSLRLPARLPSWVPSRHSYSGCRARSGAWPAPHSACGTGDRVGLDARRCPAARVSTSLRPSRQAGREQAIRDVRCSLPTRRPATHLTTAAG